MNSKFWDVIICNATSPKIDPATVTPVELLREWLKTILIANGKKISALHVMDSFTIALMEYFELAQLQLDHILKPDGMSVSQFLETAIAALLNYIARYYGDEPRGIDFDAASKCFLKERELFLSKELSAMEVVKSAFDFLSETPGFYWGPVSELSDGMLVKYFDGASPLENGIVYDILWPNLYCVLLLEAIGQKMPNGKDSTLSGILEQQNPDASLSEISRLVVNFFPDGLKELFAVERKTKKKGSQYQISSHFPELFYAELENAKISPLSPNLKTATSMVYSKKFYESCVQAITRNGTWRRKSFGEYYLFERIFRLNAKLTLSYAEHQAENKKLLLSPRLLADCFFHSPLVIFPKGKLLHLSYEGEANEKTFKKASQFLHFWIQLSSRWFPQVLGTLRMYMEKHHICSYKEVNRFFFPRTQDFFDFREKYTPVLAEQENLNMPRQLKDRYSDIWKEFIPDSGYCAESFTPYSFEDWKLKSASEYTEATDFHALRDILESIP